MGIRILVDEANETAALYCSTTMSAFGPVFTESDTKDAYERAYAFLEYVDNTYSKDLRTFDDKEIEHLYSKFLVAEPAIYKAEEAKDLED
jgi:hypothetical protein